MNNEELKKEINEIIEADIQIRHTYPPIWRWPVHKKTKIIFNLLKNLKKLNSHAFI